MYANAIVIWIMFIKLLIAPVLKFKTLSESVNLINIGRFSLIYNIFSNVTKLAQTLLIFCPVKNHLSSFLVGIGMMFLPVSSTLLPNEKVRLRNGLDILSRNGSLQLWFYFISCLNWKFIRSFWNWRSSVIFNWKLGDS